MTNTQINIENNTQADSSNQQSTKAKDSLDNILAMSTDPDYTPEQIAEAVENTESKTDSDDPLFTDFDLHPKLLTALDAMGFASPTGVQNETLKSALAGNDLMVSAQTGSGKTLAFLLPALSHVLATLNEKSKDKSLRQKAQPQILVICPTRELVQQVTQDAIKLVKYTRIRVGNVMGGMPYGKQIAGIKGAQIVIATPGRLLDLAQRGQIDLNAVSHMILDEADRMLDLGFSEDLASISEHCKDREQTLLFSATFAKEIVGLAKKLMNNPERISLANSQDKHTDITQSMYWADDGKHKKALLLHWLKTEEINQAVIFVPTQKECDELTEALREDGQNVVNLHGGMRQFMRMKRIKALRDGKAKILVATDVAARGLDVPNISHVINYGLPMKNEDYVHRIGRTGRAGRSGNAITVAMQRDHGRLKALEQFLTQSIQVLEVEGMEPSPYQPRNKRPSSRRRGAPRPNRSEGGYRGRSSGGGYKGKSEGGYKGKSEGGYKGKSEGGYKGKSEGGYKGKSEGGYKGKSEGGYKGKSEGGYKGKSEGGYKGKSEGGYKGKSEGGYRGKGKSEGFGGSDKPRARRRKPTDGGKSFARKPKG